MTSGNIDVKTVAGFGEQWGLLTQAEMEPGERQRIFDRYFSIFPWDLLPKQGATGADIGCGSGRWAALVAPRVAKLHLVDASEAALEVAKRNLCSAPNVDFHHANIDELPFADGSLDFAYSLGVVHHVPDTRRAVQKIATKLKPRSPLLLYIYYSFDNRPAWYRWLWMTSDVSRRVVARLPGPLRYTVSQLAAGLVYWPLARTGWLLGRLFRMPTNWPLGNYANKSFYVMRTDALDRLGTRLEHRFSRAQIQEIMGSAGLADVRFSDAPPYWCAVGIKR